MSGEKTDPDALTRWHLLAHIAGVTGAGAGAAVNEKTEPDVLAAVAFGILRGRTMQPPLTRSALLAEVARMCSDTPEPAPKMTAADAIDAVAKAWNDDADARTVNQILADLRKAVSS